MQVVVLQMVEELLLEHLEILHSWYHIMLVLDSTQSTELDRAKIYINGTQDTTIGATRTISQNYSFSFFRSNAENFIGNMGGTSEFFDGYLTEINFIDGQALDPSYFGYTDSQTGIWRPKNIQEHLEIMDSIFQ